MAPALTDRWHGVLRIRLDESPRRNPLSLDTVRSLCAALADDPASVAVLGSTDPTIFSAGADLSVQDDVRQQISAELYDCYRLMLTRPGLVVAVVEGAAVGGGAQLATAADLRLTGPGARYRWVGPGHGLVVGGWILPQLVGRGRALDLAVTGRWVDAAEAAQIGLAGPPTEDPWAHAQDLLDRIVALDPDALTRLKQLSLHGGLLDALAAERHGNSTWDGRPPGRHAARRPPSPITVDR